jgi:hypothetical protein
MDHRKDYSLRKKYLPHEEKVAETLPSATLGGVEMMEGEFLLFT